MINKDRNTMKWTAGIYARVSTDKDNQKLSNEHQISSMEEWATGQKNVEIYDTYIDEGISGTKIDKRYSFQRMIKDAKNGVINFIIVKSVTRFARNQIDSIKLASELKEKGVRIFFYQEGIDTFEDSKMLGLWAWLAENESRVTSERRSLGGREAQKKGRFTNNRPPFGYRTVNGKLVINEEESPIVTRIFNLYAEGNGFAKIASILNEEGMKTRRGFNFRSDKIKYMLLNESYKGTFTGNRYTKADMLSKQVIEKPKEDWIIIEDNHDSIINKELFDTVHALMNEKSFTLGKRSKSYFAGVVKCAKCGCGYNRSITKKKTKGGYKEHIYYRCSGRTQKGESTCNSKPIKEELLLEVVQNEMNLLKRNPDIIENIKKQTLAQITDKINNIDSDIINIENRVTEIESDRKMLAKKNIKGVIDDDIFMEMDAELKAELKSLNQRKNKTRIVDSAKIFEKRYDDFVNTLLHFDDIRNLNNIEVRRLLEVVEINDDEISIEIKINAVDFGIEESLNIAPIISTIGMKLQLIKNANKPIHNKASTEYFKNVNVSVKYA
ncbi:site-specific DNA recombinase [Psychrobacillus phage Perkons]|nr:site-specific DNA recombinase [Psychrobacillus phage Perkons]